MHLFAALQELPKLGPFAFLRAPKPYVAVRGNWRCRHEMSPTGKVIMRADEEVRIHKCTRRGCGRVEHQIKKRTEIT